MRLVQVVESVAVLGEDDELLPLCECERLRRRACLAMDAVAPRSDQLIADAVTIFSSRSDASSRHLRSSPAAPVRRVARDSRLAEASAALAFSSSDRSLWRIAWSSTSFLGDRELLDRARPRDLRMSLFGRAKCEPACRFAPDPPARL